MTANEILKKHEDANEMHFHEVDRKFIIEAMEEYAKEKSEKPFILELSDEEIEKEAPFSKSTFGFEQGQYQGFIMGAKWYREQLKNKQLKSN